MFVYLSVPDFIDIVSLMSYIHYLCSPISNMLNKLKKHTNFKKYYFTILYLYNKEKREGVFRRLLKGWMDLVLDSINKTSYSVTGYITDLGETEVDEGVNGKDRTKVTTTEGMKRITWGSDKTRVSRV